MLGLSGWGVRFAFRWVRARTVWVGNLGLVGPAGFVMFRGELSIYLIQLLSSSKEDEGLQGACYRFRMFVHPHSY